MDFENLVTLLTKFGVAFSLQQTQSNYSQTQNP